MPLKRFKYSENNFLKVQNYYYTIISDCQFNLYIQFLLLEIKKNCYVIANLIKKPASVN